MGVSHVQTLRSKIPSLVERLLSGYVNANQESRLKQVSINVFFPQLSLSLLTVAENDVE